MPRIGIALGLGLVLAVAGSAGAVDQESSTSDAATLEFVKLQEPELAELLSFMKTRRNKDYNAALDEIRRVRERLEGLKNRDRELHDVELALWRNAAQLRLWAAAVSASAKTLGEADRAKLKELIERENDLTLQRLNIDKARAETRLEQLKQQIAKRQEQAESVVAKGIKTWESRIERPGKAKNKVSNEKSK